MRQHKFKAFFLLIVVAAALLTGCLGGSGKESEAEVKLELNKLIDGFASAVAGQDLDAALEYFAADITLSLISVKTCSTKYSPLSLRQK